MKFLLTSSGFDNPRIFNKLVDLVGKSAEKIKIVYIPTAANGEEDSSYIIENKKEIMNAGILEKNLIDFDLDKKPNCSQLENIDALYIEGGNTFYLAKKFREENFDSKVKSLLKKGIVYVGVSAGSVIAGKRIDIASPFDENKVGLTDYRGMKLTNKIITPHYNSKEKRIIEKYENRIKEKVLKLNDGEALLCIDKEEKIIK
ncbi:MAG: Type 1 glutamine amidotransferase-like domain-containing protein [Candidatus Pacearchaeota archaeon]|jgi:dipeptidase E